MATPIKVNQIKTKVRGLFEQHLSLEDIAAHDAERDPKILSRCLAALAIYIETGCTEKEAAASVWDGSDDNGIDAAYYDPVESRVILVQSKWIEKGTGEPPSADIGTFLRGVHAVIENIQTKFHLRLQPKLSEISKKLNEIGTCVHLVVVSTGASNLATHAQTQISQILEELNGGDPDPMATSKILGQSEVFEGLVNDPLKNSINLDATILDWSTVHEPILAYIGMIDGLRLKEWWKIHGKRVVARNIRHALGSTDVNLEIRNTAENRPENFWYFNNGITLVADDVEKAPANAASHAAGNFRFSRASIVNGAQTVSSLARVDNDENLGKVRVPIRIIILKNAPQSFGNEVTRTNNLQNRIELRDFVSRDPQHIRLQREMGIENVDYQYARSEDAQSGPHSCELLELTTALACASGDPSLAVHVKTGISRIFLDLDRAPYKALFNPDLDGARGFNCVLLLREIDKWIAVKQASAQSGTHRNVLIHGNRILGSAVFKKYHNDRLNMPIERFRQELNVESVAQLCEEIYLLMVDAIQAHYPNRFLAVVFKNPSISKRIFDIATGAAPSGSEQMLPGFN